MRAWPKAVNSSPVRYRGERSVPTQKPAFGEPGVPGAGITGGGAVLGGTLVDGGGVTGGGNVPGGVVGGTLIGAPGFTGGGMEGGTGAIFGPGVRPVSGKLAFGLLVMATAGKGKLFVEVPTPVELVLDEEVPPAAVELLKKLMEGSSHEKPATFGHWSRAKLGARVIWSLLASMVKVRPVPGAWPAPRVMPAGLTICQGTGINRPRSLVTIAASVQPAGLSTIFSILPAGWPAESRTRAGSMRTTIGCFVSLDGCSGALAACGATAAGCGGTGACDGRGAWGGAGA